MQEPTHTLSALFAQLGLDNSEQAIDEFIRQQAPLPPAMQLHEAPCWTPAQSKLLLESVLVDADWALVVDTLDTLLRKKD
jgi:Protein of unknown function (DUF2789).